MDSYFCQSFHLSRKFMADQLVKPKANFGTLPVYLTAISTILGAIMFLRFGYAVGNLGFYGVLLIVLIGHMVTIPTAMSLAEIATNQKVKGGGEYYIISRSFGLNIGSSIGIALYFSQAISVAFYVIAFAEAFDPVISWLHDSLGFTLADKRFISMPVLGLLIWLMLKKGADIGMKALYVVVATLIASLVLFFLGKHGCASGFSTSHLFDHISRPDGFFIVFAICFPAFTGMTAGVGLSGDLKNPGKSIPFGTLAATITGMIIYCFIAYKLATCASPEDLDSNQLIMGKIALWGPIIPIGLAAATLSSALGSFMIAPRTLQALGGDKIFPMRGFNSWVSKGTADKNEPVNASVITSVIAVFFVMMGDVNAVAGIISMFFMVTYGSICTISFFQHFSADPSYRPSFKSRWYISLLGALMCLYIMFNMNAVYAIAALVIMVLLYIVLSHYSKEKSGMATIFQGVIFQLSRNLQVFLQKAEKEKSDDNWRPSIICISKDSFTRFAAFDLMRWMSHKYGFGTYIHFIKGMFSAETRKESEVALSRLIEIADLTHSNVYLDTMISPSFTSAIAQLVQLPGISGKDNNMLLFEFSKTDPAPLGEVLDNFHLVQNAEFDLCILGTSERDFGHHRELHIWITKNDYQNASLMILLGYIILGHPDWRKGQIKLFALYPRSQMAAQKEKLLQLTSTGRLPISPANIRVLGYEEGVSLKDVINRHSSQADLTVRGISEQVLTTHNPEVFSGYDQTGNMLFVYTGKEKLIR
ncbi:MAG: hypothetical protein ACE5DN_02065 [Flavobacteriales bacterium]